MFYYTLNPMDAYRCLMLSIVSTPFEESFNFFVLFSHLEGTA